jgi:hypothetical protein
MTGPPHGGPGHHHPRAQAASEQGFRTCLGILRLAKRDGTARLEPACQRAQATGLSRGPHRLLPARAAAPLGKGC